MYDAGNTRVCLHGSCAILVEGCAKMLQREERRCVMHKQLGEQKQWTNLVELQFGT